MFGDHDKHGLLPGQETDEQDTDWALTFFLGEAP